METGMMIDNSLEEQVQKLRASMLHVTHGLWIDGNVYWVRDRFERIIEQEAISVVIKEIDIHSRTKLQNVYIRNHGDRQRNIKLLFIHHYPNVTDEILSFVSPIENIIYHVIKDQIFLVNGYCKGNPMEQMTVQPLWHLHSDAVWHSLEKGSLRYQPMAKGMTGSLFSLQVQVDRGQTIKATSWSIVGSEKEELLLLDRSVKKHTSISL